MDAPVKLPLADPFGRVHRSLRISVTDRCNIRCQYCMPEVATFLPSDRLLSFDEIAEFVRTAATLGLRDLRITGGEPLMRPQLEQLIAQLSAIDAIEDVALTTNGMLLAEHCEALVAAGLRRVNISLDTLNEEVFRRLSRRSGLDRVLEGIAAATAQPRLQVRLNALVMRDVNYDEVLELVEFARQRALPIRFIEFMPLDAERAWKRTQMVSGDELRARLATRYGGLVALPRRDPSQPSNDYTFADGAGVVGFIDSVSQPFCGACDRLRLTADGKLRNCLFGLEEWDVRSLLRGQACQPTTARGSPSSARQGISPRAADIESVIRACLSAKRAAHGIDASDFSPPERAMFQIGG
jgi:cyclic pyranopterin phosphate synthase